jgi:hypothetical protein
MTKRGDQISCPAQICYSTGSGGGIHEQNSCLTNTNKTCKAKDCCDRVLESYQGGNVTAAYGSEYKGQRSHYIVVYKPLFVSQANHLRMKRQLFCPLRANYVDRFWCEVAERSLAAC